MKIRFWPSGKAAVSTTGWNRPHGGSLAAGYGEENTDARQHAENYDCHEYCQHAADFAGFLPSDR
jgi:hypothetical protein